MTRNRWIFLYALGIGLFFVCACLLVSVIAVRTQSTPPIAQVDADATWPPTPIVPTRAPRPTAVPSPRPTAVPSPRPTAVPSPRPTATPAPTAAKTLTPGGALQQLALDGLKTDSFGDMFLTLKSTALTGITATIDYATSDNVYNQESSVVPFMEHLQYVVPQVFDQFGSVGVVVVRESTGLVDTYGKKSDGIVIVLSITRATNSKIDWKNFRPKNLPKVLTAKNEVFAVGPALSSGWSTYQQKY